VRSHPVVVMVVEMAVEIAVKVEVDFDVEPEVPDNSALPPLKPPEADMPTTERLRGGNASSPRSGHRS
jgi:hypothetical protein